jgi:hypothetical protein
MDTVEYWAIFEKNIFIIVGYSAKDFLILSGTALKNL